MGLEALAKAFDKTGEKIVKNMAENSPLISGLSKKTQGAIAHGISGSIRGGIVGSATGAVLGGIHGAVDEDESVGAGIFKGALGGGALGTAGGAFMGTTGMDKAIAKAIATRGVEQGGIEVKDGKAFVRNPQSGINDPGEQIDDALSMMRKNNIDPDLQIRPRAEAKTAQRTTTTAGQMGATPEQNADAVSYFHNQIPDGDSFSP
jgi:hypothetical protein